MNKSGIGFGSAQPAHGFTLATAEAERFMREQMGNPKSLCANARNKNPLWSRVGDQVAGTHVATASARPLATKAGAGAAAPPPTLPPLTPSHFVLSKLAKQAKRQQSSTPPPTPQPLTPSPARSKLAKQAKRQQSSTA